MKQAKALSFFQVSVLLSAVTLFTILTFQSYFFFWPLSNGFSVLSFLQLLTLPGWLCLVALPPIFFANEKPWSSGRVWLFTGLISLWTFATTLIKVYTLITLGKIWIEYLYTYPIMFFFEWLLPAIYIWMAFHMRAAQSTSNSSDF